LVSYCGTNYNGSQIQPNGKTIEKELSIVISKIFKSKIKLQFSGRTDKGVHAEGQVFNFIHEFNIPLDNLKYAINNSLPKDIYVNGIELVNIEFNSRFSAKSREYRYYISNEYVGQLLHNRVYHTSFNYNEKKIIEFITLFKGKRDFKFFRSVGSNENNTIREIFDFTISKIKNTNWYGGWHNDIFIYEIKIIGNAFLYRMVRNIIGCLIEFCNDKITKEEIEEQFKMETKILKYELAPAYGLTLVNVCY